jgi:hypothetical protein
MENAPISSPLSSAFKKYAEAMQAITEANLTKRKDAEDLFAKYEEVFTALELRIMNRTEEYDNSS